MALKQYFSAMTGAYFIYKKDSQCNFYKIQCFCHKIISSGHGTKMNFNAMIFKSWY